MTRRAVVIGSNGPPGPGALKYAERDADRMADTLRNPRCGFLVTHPSNSNDPKTVERAVEEAAEASSEGDTLIVYFSGHGSIEGGGLLLMLDGTTQRRPLTTALHADSLVRSMRYSAARRKLLILDCCHAGMVFSDSRFKSEAGTKMASVIAEVDESEAFVALMASDRLERAREVEDLQGSFLTSEFCSALGERFQEADHDDDGAIDLKDLTKWLAARATKYNAAHPTSKVPKPFVFGRERGQLYLTLDPSAWLTHEITTEAGYVFCVLPLRASASSVQLIGKTLVTNAQYRAFVAATGYGDPSGKQFVKGKWIGPFEPWRDANFSAEDLPVVCVNFSDAERFCDWANRDDDARSIHLVPTAVWDFAAFGRMRPSYDRRLWRDEFMQHPTKTPRSVAAHDASVNRFGILDLFGNVWQWTDSGGRGHADVVLAADKHWKSRNQGLRGGSFLDDSERMSPVLIAGALAKGVRTRHSDLGFRMAAVIDLDDLPDDVARRVSEGPILEERDYPLSNVPPFASDMPS